MEDERKRATRLVREILAGKPVSEVPSSKFPILKEKLNEMRNDAIQLNQLRRIRVIQSILTQMSVIEARERERTINKNKGPAPTDQQIESVLQNLMQTKSTKTVENDMIPYLVRYIKNSVLPGLLKDEDFFKAHEYQTMREKLESESRNRRRENTKRETYEKIIKALEDAETKMDLENQEHENALNQWELDVADALERLNTKNTKELEDFDATTQGPLPAFTKTFSSNVQNLAATQEHLVKAKRFKDAGLVHEKLTQLKSVELGIIEDKHLRKRDAERQTLIEHQQQQVKCLLDKFEASKLTMVKAHDKLVNSLKYTIANLESRLFFLYHSTQMERKGEDYTPETDWMASIPVGVRTQLERRLAKRQPWIAGSSRRVNETEVSVGVEPYWKSDITVGQTEVVPQHSRSTGNSPIKKKRMRRTASLSRTKSKTVRFDTSKSKTGQKTTDDKSSHRSTALTTASRSNRSEAGRTSIAGSGVSKRSQTPQASNQSCNVTQSMSRSVDSKKTTQRRRTDNTNRLGFTQEVDARRSAAAQTKKNIGISHLVKKQTEFEKFCDTVPPTKKTNF